jgi:hypothetical protein
VGEQQASSVARAPQSHDDDDDGPCVLHVSGDGPCVLHVDGDVTCVLAYDGGQQLVQNVAPVEQPAVRLRIEPGRPKPCISTK